MDSAFAVQWSIPQQQVSPPVLVETIDGQPLHSSPVIAVTRRLHMRIGPHVEEAIFYVATVPHFLVVLGLEWLRAHDPHVIWSSGAVRFPGKKCATHHLHAYAGNVATHVDLNLPADLGDYADVFGEKEADQLPPHWSYDCPIYLVPDAKLPVGRFTPCWNQSWQP
ncbi:PEG10: Retrotransposon-derived protein PEG10 [Crotalus adamanteus]|uniref:PEG10: Retrotransposon-derived protein PEG10 n=1 Tax=Crotalus adamanteus TaxID=8729 RepID=A0AAW1B2H2_CROAD